jgi:hypothetical protein
MTLFWKRRRRDPALAEARLVAGIRVFSEVDALATVAAPGKASVVRNYSLSEAGSDRFFGDFLLSVEIISCAAGGTETAPLRTMSSASTFL